MLEFKNPNVTVRNSDIGKVQYLLELIDKVSPAKLPGPMTHARIAAVNAWVFLKDSVTIYEGVAIWHIKPMTLSALHDMNEIWGMLTKELEDIEVVYREQGNAVWFTHVIHIRPCSLYDRVIQVLKEAQDDSQSDNRK